MNTLNKIRDFVDEEVRQGNNRCYVIPSSKLSDVVYVHVNDNSLSFSFLSRLANAVSSDFEVFCNHHSSSFDIQFILD